MPPEQMAKEQSIKDTWLMRFSAVLRSERSVRLEKIYLLSAAVIVIGLSEMALMRSIDFDMGHTMPVVAFLWMFTSLVCLMLLVYTEMVMQFPINWTLAIVSAQGMALCTMCFNWNSVDILYAGSVVGVVVVVNFIVYLWAAVMPLLLLPSYIFMVAATVFFIISYSLISIIVYVIHYESFLVISEALAVFYVILLAVYGGTIIHDRRNDAFTKEILVSSTVVSSFFFAMLHLALSTLIYSRELYDKYGPKTKGL